MTFSQHCPICRSSTIRGLLFREQVPVQQNLLAKDRFAAINVTRGDLDVVVCEECGFVFNRMFDPGRLGYGEGYEGEPYHSPSFSAYLDELVHHIIAESGVRDCQIVEVGCGQGFFLRKLVEFEGAGNRGHGFDPGYQGEPIELDGRLKFERRYYDRDCTNVPTDVVVARHVIEHIPDPLGLLYSIRETLVDSPNAKVFCETPCVEWILRNRVIWDFFYEHCSYFSAPSLTAAFELAGFRVESVRRIFQGQYLWLEATLPRPVSSSVAKRPGRTVTLSAEFACAEPALSEAWRRKIREMASQEKIALWGAGAKGVTLANLIDPRQEFIDCIVDLSPQKQGRFIPGTGHPVLSPEDLPGRAVTTAILMNPNYHDENLAILRQAKIDVRLVEEI